MRHVVVDSPFLDCGSASRYLGVSLSYLAKARMRGEGPRFIRLKGLVKYQKADLDRFMEERLVETRRF